uniref:HTH cro/C1-type domain-containing protein n=1 Tax=Shewanella sp. (strain MR-7) TaxID=60481 RepID=Q0HUB1_SHESR
MKRIEVIVAYKFSTKLESWIEQRKMSRKDLIALLQCEYYDIFEGLDLITLSRWVNGKSTPPLYKQLYVAKVLGVNIVDIIKEIDVLKQKSSNKAMAAVNLISKALDFSISSFSYVKLPEVIFSEVIELKGKAYNDVFGDFYKNIVSFRDFNQFLSDKDISYFALLLKNEDGLIVGHWSGIANLEAIDDISHLLKIDNDELKKSVLVKPGYYTSSKHYFELICVAICYYLLNYAKEKDYAYFFIVDFQPMLSFCKIVFEAEEVKYYRNSDNKMGVYLMRFNIIKAISNPVVIKDVQARLLCLSNCDGKCKQCNLKSFLN